MRVLGAIFAVMLGVSGGSSAWAQASNYPEAPDTTASLPPANQPAGPRSSGSSAARPSATLRDSYAAIPLSERITVQSELLWAGLYNGPVNGEYSEQLVAAVRAFQRQNKTKITGVLNPAERQALVEFIRPMQEQVGWRIVQDTNTGARVGLPWKLVPIATRGKTGSIWSSQQGQVRIETFRITASDATLANVFEQQKNEPVERRVEQQALRPDSFVVIGMQGLKKFHVRGYARNGEIRGITILYDQAVDGTMDPLVAMLASAYQPFANSVATTQDNALPRRMVEYGTGLVVSTSGHIVTDRQVVDGCQVVVVPGLGNAERVAEDKDKDLVLLRVYGTDDLVPLALLGEAAKGPDLTVVGIADPQSQGGNAAISTSNARLINATSASGPVSTLNQTPGLGFSGAAVLDKSGRFFGMVGLRTPVVAGTAPAAPKATIVPVETIRSFIEANFVAPTSGQSGLDHCKSAVVRVICVRK